MRFLTIYADMEKEENFKQENEKPEVSSENKETEKLLDENHDQTNKIVRLGLPSENVLKNS